MSRIGIIILSMFLSGCGTAVSVPQPATSSEDTITLKEYQECIQSAMEGQPSTEKCEKIQKNAR